MLKSFVNKLLSFRKRFLKYKLRRSQKYLLPIILILLITNLVLVSYVFPQYKKNPDTQKLSPPKDSCFSIENPYKRMSCLKPYLEERTMTAPASEVVAETLEWKNQGLIPTCHLVGHYIGDANLVKHNFDVGKAIVSCSMSCDEGCVHGVMEGHLLRLEDPRMFVARTPYFCDSVSEDEAIRRQCYHGLGHGLMRHGSLDLNTAIDTCRIISYRAYSFVCEGAVLMEYVFEYLASNQEGITEKLPEICNAFFPHFDKSKPYNNHLVLRCISQIGSAVAVHTNNNEDESTKLCQNLPTEHQGLCIDAAQRQIKDNLKEQ